MKYCKKSFNFDLDTHKLKEYYPKKSISHAYDDIYGFLLNHGFEHRMGSGYVSKSKLSVDDVYALVTKLGETYTWLDKCVKRFDVTDVGRDYDMLGFIKEGASLAHEKTSIEVSVSNPGLDELINSAVKVRDEQQKHEAKSQNVENVR